MQGGLPPLDPWAAEEPTYLAVYTVCYLADAAGNGEEKPVLESRRNSNPICTLARARPSTQASCNTWKDSGPSCDAQLLNVLDKKLKVTVELVYIDKTCMFCDSNNIT